MENAKNRTGAAESCTRLITCEDGDAFTATTSPAPESPVLTVDETAALLRVDRKTVYAMISRHEVPGVRRVGRALRISRDAVLEWLRTGQGCSPRSRRIR
jgi:excisionase family DNA binding protein